MEQKYLIIGASNVSSTVEGHGKIRKADKVMR